MAVDLTQYVSPLVRQRQTYTPSQVAQATPPPDYSASPAVQQYYRQRNLTPAGTTFGTPAGNPTSTQITYGFGNDQFLTNSQQQIADSVQHAFDVSLAQRDRDLQRYQMPQLASNVEDEALARAIATANLANQRTNPYGITGGARGGGGRGGGGGGGGGGTRLPAGYNPYMRAPTGPDAGQSWRQFLSGATSLAPLLFGKDAFGNFMNKGVFGWIKDQFGNNIPVDQNGQPFDQATVYGAGSGWGQDIYGGQPMLPDYTQDLGTPIDYGGGATTYPYIDYGFGGGEIPSWDVSGFEPLYTDDYSSFF